MRDQLPSELVDRLNEIGRLAVLAGLTIDEAIATLNIATREHGFEYRLPKTEKRN